MSDQLGKLGIQLTLDQVRFQQNLERAQNKARQFSSRTVQYLNNIEKAAKNLNNLSRLNFWSGLAGGRLVELKNYADSYTEIKNRLNLVESAGINASRGMESVFDIALRTNQSISATSTVYQKFAQNASSLKISQEQVASLTETVSKAVAISGSSAASAEAAITQFGQALGSGVLRGDEFNSVMEQAPGLAQALARGLGVTTGELREMANDGKLTMDVLIPALEKAKSTVDAQFSTRVLTISAAFENLNTSVTKWIGETDQMFGISRRVADVINGLAGHLTTLAAAATSVGAAYSINKIRSFISESNAQANVALKAAQAEVARTAALRQEAQAEMSLIQIKIAHARTEAELVSAKQLAEVQSRKLTNAINMEAAAQRNLAIAQKSANIGNRALGAALGFVGGPVGATIIGITALAGAFYEYSQKTEQARQDSLAFADSLDVTAESLKAMTGEVLGGMKAKLEQSIGVQREELAKLRDELAKLEQQAKNSARLMSEHGLSDNKTILEAYNKLLQEVAIKKGEVSAANQKLEKSERNLATITEQVPVAELNSKLKELLPSLDLSKVNIDNVGFSLEDLNRIFPSAESGTVSITSAVEKMGAMALLVAGQFDALGLSIQTALSDKAQNIIDRQNRQIAINNAKTPEEARRLKAEDAAINAGFKKGTADYDAVYNNSYELFKSQEDKKERDKAKKKGAKTDYVKQYTEQLTQMQQRLAELKANAQDIALFGQPSQYQEVNKLTQDIAANGEKYAHFGTEGLAKLKEMAAKIDSTQQKVAINQFTYDNTEKLEAMEFELTLLGKTRQEQELMQYNHQLDLEAARLKIGMSEENIAKLDEEIAKLKARRAEIQKQNEESRGSAMIGFQQGMQTIEDQVSNVAGNISNLTVSAFNNMSDALTDFVMTGKADFRGMAVSIMRDISNMIVKMMLFNAIKSAANAVGFGFSGGGVVGSPDMRYVGGLVGFDGGGFTGLGGKYTPAGIVHKGEYVLTKEATSRIGLDYLNYLNYGNAFRGRGFANGGGVGVPRLPQVNYEAGRASGNISVKVINNGEPMDANVTQKQRNGQMEITVELMRQIARAESNDVIQQNMRAGGIFAR
ncbi:phage tail tape measure protein [Rodentibacter caecimuris]|uniref:phage tail tape measure protein n=1 Tax=Rodentibacter caecimuris TaxID=1796644 RepID=UPI00211A89A3|nr:phage tail tape measure protein [Rodentibacter heylii]MCQ9122892.1 phage tail tape measure protein [Rodentibacter heylii]